LGFQSKEENMGLFYNLVAPSTAVNLHKKSGETALAPSTPAKQQLSLARLGLAVGFLVVILAVGLIASAYKIEPWNSVLPSAFQLLVGAVIGAVIGEHIGSSTNT
jgi:NhaP-type Na+/H+ or K+/H+ antiporter